MLVSISHVKAQYYQLGYDSVRVKSKFKLGAVTTGGLTDSILTKKPNGGVYKVARSSFGSGTVTSITPGIGFVSHTAITSAGTIDIDTAGLIAPKVWIAANNWTKAQSDARYEATANKQNSLTPDGSGVKFPTVDAINALDATLVHKSGAETVSGPKTLSSTLNAEGGIISYDFLALKKTSVPTYRLDFQPPTLTANRVQTTQDDDGVIALTKQFESGTYTPTITNTLNVTSSTPIKCHYTRIGNEVTVQGQATITNTGAGAVEFQVTLPPGLTSNLAAPEDLTEQGVSYIASDAVFCDGDTTTDRARVRYTAAITGPGAVKFSFTYTIIP